MSRFGIAGPSPLDVRDYPVSAIIPVVALPAEVRLDDKVLSIRDQWVFPACVGKSGASIMSAGFNEELSSIFIYSKCKELDGIPDLPGTYPRTACQVMLHYGSCTANSLPYSQMSDPVPQLKTAHYAEADSRKIKQYARAAGLRDIKLALANGHFVMGSMLVGDNFMTCNDDTTVGPPTGELYGYHAIVVCGYSDHRQAVRIANSWGEGWGDKGFAWLSYSVFSNIAHWPEAWVIEVEQEEPKTAEEFYPDRIFRELRRYLKKKLLGVDKMFWEKESFYGALLAVLVPVLNHFFGWGLEVGTIAMILIPLLALIIGDKWEAAKVAEAEARISIAAIQAGAFDVEK